MSIDYHNRLFIIGSEESIDELKTDVENETVGDSELFSLVIPCYDKGWSTSSRRCSSGIMNNKTSYWRIDFISRYYHFIDDLAKLSYCYPDLVFKVDSAYDDLAYEGSEQFPFLTEKESIEYSRTLVFARGEFIDGHDGSKYWMYDSLQNTDNPATDNIVSNEKNSEAGTSKFLNTEIHITCGNATIYNN